MNTHVCPVPDRLHDYVVGRLDLPGHEAVESHLDDCTACQAAVETLDHGPSFARFRAAAPPLAEDSLLRRLADRAKALPIGPPPPRALGQYRLLEPLGAGGMGRVYRAEHTLMKRTVAIKLLAADLFRSTAAKARFRREVELAGRVASPHIVAALDAGEIDGQTFLVMEHVAGRDLAQIVKQDGPLPLRRALEVARQAALGLADAHDAGVVHRDVKPSNLLVDGHGTVKVLDLGLARARLAADDAPADLTTSQAVMGTAAYMAPEQAADTRRADARADVYSLGCTLFFLLTGRPPFAEATVMATLFAHREKPLPSLRQARPDCPVEVEALFRRMTARRPEDRPASMRAVAAELDRLLAAPAPRRRHFLPAAVAVASLMTAAVLLLGALGPPTPHATETPPSEPTAAEKGPQPDPAPAPVAAVKPVGPEMVLIKPGEFWMGSPDGDADAEANEKPRHQVQITYRYLLGKYEVTQGEFTDLMGGNCATFSPEGRAAPKLPPVDPRKLPIESVRWLDALEYCNRLSAKHGLKPYYKIDKGLVLLQGGPGYRLPTEAEWEHACRAGTETRWSFGDDAAKLDEYAWYAKNAGRMPHPVGEKKANAWGLYDMHGNAAEWCWDRFDASYYKRSVVSDPPGSGEGESRVYRGGSWNHNAGQTRSADRNSLGLGYGPLALVGFRVARDAD